MPDLAVTAICWSPLKCSPLMPLPLEVTFNELPSRLLPEGQKVWRDVAADIQLGPGILTTLATSTPALVATRSKSQTSVSFRNAHHVLDFFRVHFGVIFVL